MYTDGSGRQSIVGAEFSWYYISEDVSLEKSIRMPDHETIFTAELWAIVRASLTVGLDLDLRGHFDWLLDLNLNEGLKFGLASLTG